MSNTKQTLREEIRTWDMMRLMIKLSPVAVLAMSVNSINMFVDGLFVGQFLGEDALSAISLAFPLAFITNGFAAMIGVGASSILSIAIGENDDSKQRKIFGTVVVLSVIFGALLIAFGWYFAGDLIAAIGGAGDILEMGTLYYRTLILGAFFQLFAVGLNMVIRAEGNIKDAMRIAIIGTVSNIILNPIFIGYFDMGIAGVAYATILSMVVFSLLDILYFVTKRASYPVDLTYYKLEKSLVRPIITVGVSAMMLQIMFVVQQLVVFKMIDLYGDNSDIAFMGASYRVMILMLVPGFGFSSALQPVAGINYGAKDYARVKKAFWIFGISSTTLTTILLIVFVSFPRLILGLLLPDTIFTGEDILNFRLMMSPGFLFSFFFMGIILYQSIGNAKMAGMVMLLRELVFFVPFVIVLPIWFGITGIYATPIIQNVITLGIAGYLVLRTFKQWDKEIEDGLVEITE